MKFNFEEVLQKSMDHLPDGKVKEAALYSLLSGGKRFRPQLLFSTLNVYHVSEEKGINAAIALEMIHTYSLIHDDLPSMDNDDLRRGQPTCHIKYGEEIAILAGDALLNEAFHYAAQACTNTSDSLLLVQLFAEYSGLNGMIHGQELDIENRYDNYDIEKLKEVNVYKTSKLITLALLSACIIADHKGDRETWEIIGKNIGLIFQIQDDILDITSTSDELGKHVHSDEKNHKSTYATVLGIERCNEINETLMNEVINLLDTMLIDKQPLIDTLEGLLNRKN